MATGLAACGEDDFKNEPRAPVPVNLTGVVQSDKVTVSPAKVGGGPVIITIANQTDDPHEIIPARRLGERERGPGAPTAAGTIRRTLEQR